MNTILTAPKWLWGYAIVVTAALLLLAYHERLPQKILAKLSHKVPAQSAPVESDLMKMTRVHWDMKTNLYSTFSTHDKIVFVGNSITENCNWNEMFQTNVIVNRGIGGDESTGILKRIDGYLIDTPRCVVLMDGINDIARGKSFDTLLHNFDRIADKIKAKDISLIVQSTLPVAAKFGDAATVKQVNESVQRYNDYTKAYCSREGYQWVDVATSLKEGNVLNGNYTEDGVHINGAAYQKWKQVLYPVLQKYL